MHRGPAALTGADRLLRHPVDLSFLELISFVPVVTRDGGVLIAGYPGMSVGPLARQR
jgi:hypothetical protein